MAENENTVETPVQEEIAPVQNEKKDSKFKAGFKEWFRKFIVKLKHQTQLIPLVLIVITSVVYLCMLSTFSIMVDGNSGISSTGITVFVNTLVSVLVIVMFLNAFPKRKKVNKVALGAVFAMLALLIVMDILFYTNITGYAAKNYTNPNRFYSSDSSIPASLTNSIVHIVLVAIDIVVLATMPLYQKAIRKINTQKEVESSETKEEIDIVEE